ncbi:MAG: 3-oxoacid CoA-transferase [Candidatus Lokiarchaeota archaeon]|nr:3-oxoacid CoA-transferase [Candidatus Lokiarchaeota archaeon]
MLNNNINEGYTLKELMACVASRQLKNGKSVAVGTGIPLVSAMLAQQTHAPDLVIFFEAGSVAPQLVSLPISVGDSRTLHKAMFATSLVDIMDSMRRGFIDYAFLSAAQIDKYGNLNSTMIGSDYIKPKVRLPGSGGANDFASLAWEIIIIMDRHSPERFVEKVDFITSPGYLNGPGARESAGLSENTGPSRVVTDLGLFDFHPKSKRMRLIATHPGVTIEEVVNATDFELIIADQVSKSLPPTKEELHILHNVIDTEGRIFNN